jgi:hypothetical protein
MRLNQRESLTGRLEALIEKMPETKRSTLRELIQSLLEPSIHLASLKRLEDKYILALQEEQDKVLSIQAANRRSGPSRPAARRFPLRVPCLIEAQSHGEIFRLAFELHLRSSKSVFLSWRDIDPSSRSKNRSIKELTACTIFIPDVTLVPLTEQKAIADVIADEEEEKPHFMGGTTMTYPRLKQTPGLLEEFIDGMSQAYLKVTKPVSHYKQEGLIRYFIESLT